MSVKTLFQIDSSKLPYGGRAKFTLNKEDIDKVVKFVKGYSKIQPHTYLKVDKNHLTVFSNQDDIEGFVSIEVDTQVKKPFIICVFKELLYQIASSVKDKVEFVIKDQEIKLNLSKTSLTVIALDNNDLEVVKMKIETLKHSEVVIGEVFKETLDKLASVRKEGLGALEPIISFKKDMILGGSSVFFTEVDSGLKKIDVNINGAFLPYMRNLFGIDGGKQKIYWDDKHFVIGGKNMAYKTKNYQQPFPTTVEELVKKVGDYLFKGFVDRRSLQSSLNTLNIVLVGVQNPVVYIDSKGKELNLKVKSLNGKESKDKLNVVKTKGSIPKGYKMLKEFLEVAINPLSVNISIEVYENFVLIGDDTQKILFVRQL